MHKENTKTIIIPSHYPAYLLFIIVGNAPRSKTYVCGRSHVGVAVSNPAQGMDGCLL
jgi:hypothetical protein